jgi:hypothetical protein
MKLKTILILILILFGCEKANAPISVNIESAKALTNHIIAISSYRIPNGIFRGVLWPSKENPNFKVWLIEKGKEVYFDIGTPSEFTTYERGSSEEWKITLTESSNAFKTYSAHKIDGSKSLQFVLPKKRREYSFSVLMNSEGNEILIFMDISEDIVDKGLFGFIEITKKT